MKKLFSFIILCICNLQANSQLPNPVLVGYWQSWNNFNAPYIAMDLVDNRYNVIEVAFAEPYSTTDMTMSFIPSAGSQAAFIAKMNTVKAQGKKVLLSIGGANSTIDLTTITNRDLFINSITSILNTYGFEGIDLDIENGSSILNTGGTIANPTNIAQVNLIYAINQIMINYRTATSKKLLLTFAPETVYIQGGQSAFSGIWGGYLPIIEALKDSIDLLQVQLYNSGTMYGIDGNIYTEGTPDFIIAMTEAAIQGFTTTGGLFSGIPADKIAIGLPACSSAANTGFTDTASVKSAIDYLRGIGPKPGTYILQQAGGYPTLRGMMTWSINWDAVSTCASVYQYADNFTTIFGNTTTGFHEDENRDGSFSLFPNPATENVNISFKNSPHKNGLFSLFDMYGQLVYSENKTQNKQLINLSSLTPGIYFIRFENEYKTLIKQ